MTGLRIFAHCPCASVPAITYLSLGGLNSSGSRRDCQHGLSIARIWCSLADLFDHLHSCNFVHYEAGVLH